MLIGCYYYAWYSDGWLAKTVRSADRPMRGEYNNMMPGHIEAQMTEMKNSGIDFISLSWNNKDSGHVLDAANRTGMKFTYFYETFDHRDGCRVENDKFPIIRRNIRLLKEDMQEDCWLRIDGRPVLMFYVTRTLRDPISFMAMVREEIPDAFIVGDEYFWDDVPNERIIYDAITAYNMYQRNRFIEGSDEERMESYLDNSKARMLKHALQCQALSKPLWGCAMPGYNDSMVRPEKKHPILPRLDGKFFERSLNDAMAVSVGEQAMMICSYNEWYEDTQIEPCESYGMRYLDILKGFKT